MRIIYLAIVVLGTSVSAWVLKVRLKRRMQKGLGRRVDDAELTSISAWMKVKDKDMPYPRERNPFL